MDMPKKLDRPPPRARPSEHRVVTHADPGSLIRDLDQVMYGRPDVQSFDPMLIVVPTDQMLPPRNLMEHRSQMAGLIDVDDGDIAQDPQVSSWPTVER